MALPKLEEGVEIPERKVCTHPSPFPQEREDFEARARGEGTIDGDGLVGWFRVGADDDQIGVGGSVEPEDGSGGEDVVGRHREPGKAVWLPTKGRFDKLRVES